LTGIVVTQAEGPTDEVRQLVGELEAELSRHYPPEQRHGLKLDAIFQPHIRFFVAWADGHPAGCGGIALFADFAELKRMYVRPAARGRGVAEAILERLIEEAAGTGLMTVRLETGTRQTTAIRFYQRLGFALCGAFEPYKSMPAQNVATSMFMERQI
jgi:putative acetyltransferase